MKHCIYCGAELSLYEDTMCSACEEIKLDELIEAEEEEAEDEYQE